MFMLLSVCSISTCSIKGVKCRDSGACFAPTGLKSVITGLNEHLHVYHLANWTEKVARKTKSFFSLQHWALMVSQFCGACFRQKEEQMCVLVRCFAVCVYGDIQYRYHLCLIIAQPPLRSGSDSPLAPSLSDTLSFQTPRSTTNNSVYCSQLSLSLPVTMVDLWVISNSWYVTNAKCKVNSAHTEAAQQNTHSSRIKSHSYKWLQKHTTVSSGCSRLLDLENKIRQSYVAMKKFWNRAYVSIFCWCCVQSARKVG